ncbi:MAG: hypothetical protein AAF639_14205 [Chloroflexota bacterium]
MIIENIEHLSCENFFQVEIRSRENLFENFTPSGQTYDELQDDVLWLSSRLRISKDDNEATRGNLLVSRVLSKAGRIYELGIFFEPTVNYQPEQPLNLPHSLTGAYDGALSLDEIDFIAPIASVVEVKRSSLSDGFGQCIAEMYTTLHFFEQEKVYGIVTDGEVWEFLRLENAVVAVHAKNYHINSVADIVDRIGYLAKTFSI